ncbi:MAG: hypothetical protein J5711_06700 [Bacteroidales bacterium]|nr:hypothetical protein [Bacteroidales bacterium]
MKKTLFFVVAIIAFSRFSFAQGLVELTNGKCYIYETALQHDAQTISVKDGRWVKSYEMDSVVLYEDVEKGSRVICTNMIRRIPPVVFNGNEAEFLAAGRKVYIPIASPTVVQRSGSFWLCSKILDDGFWIVVGCAEEADFILEYVYDDKGKDHAYLVFYDRNQNVVLKTKSVSASDWVPTHAGQESAEKLYNRNIKKKLYKNK